MTDDFCWVAMYADGSVLTEHEPDGTEHGFADVDLGRLAAFALVPQREGLATPVVAIDPASGQRPIFFRRRTISLDPAGAEAGRQTVTVVGWQRTVRDRSVKSFMAFYENGQVRISDRDDF